MPWLKARDASQSGWSKCLVHWHFPVKHWIIRSIDQTSGLENNNYSWPIVMDSLNQSLGTCSTILKQHNWKAPLQCFTKSFLECETIWLNIKQKWHINVEPFSWHWMYFAGKNGKPILRKDLQTYRWVTVLLFFPLQTKHWVIKGEYKYWIAF